MIMEIAAFVVSNWEGILYVLGALLTAIVGVYRLKKGKQPGEALVEKLKPIVDKYGKEPKKEDEEQK